MNRAIRIQDLSREFAYALVNPVAWAVNDPTVDECYVLLQEDTDWFVYYAERGHRNNIKKFDSEEKACGYFLQLVKSDPTAKVRR